MPRRAGQTWSFKGSMDVDETDVEDLMGILASSVPARNATTAFAYGDPREMLLAGAHQARQWLEYCRNPKTVGDVEFGGPSDDNCRDDNYVGSDIVASLMMLNSYGIQGDVSVRRRVPTQSVAGGQTAMKSVSLLKDCTLDEPGCRPGVPFCSIGKPDSPVGLLGFRLTADELVARVLAASVGCESAARRAQPPEPGPSGGAESDYVLALLRQRSEGAVTVAIRGAAPARGAFTVREVSSWRPIAAQSAGRIFLPDCPAARLTAGVLLRRRCPQRRPLPLSSWVSLTASAGTAGSAMAPTAPGTLPMAGRSSATSAAPGSAREGSTT
jgi:hypothetical protein